MKQLLLAVAVGVTTLSTSAFALDADLATYTKTTGVTGNLSSVGSDTLANLMNFWSEGFRKEYPNVQIQVQAAGSSTAPPALTQGTSQLGPMSRTMKGEEIQAFEKKYGYKPTAVPVAIDALALYVHKDNPLKQTSLAVVDAMFSSARKCGFPKDVTKWSDAGVGGALGNQTITMFGRNSVSGTYGYFKEHALCKGDFKNGVIEQPGAASVVQAVAANLNAIGYSGIGYSVSGVKTLAIKGSDGEFYQPNAKNALSGKYPLSRYLYVYVNKAPGKPLDPATREFVKYVLSKQGQAVVEKDGYVALPASVAKKTAKALGL